MLSMAFGSFMIGEYQRDSPNQECRRIYPQQQVVLRLQSKAIIDIPVVDLI